MQLQDKSEFKYLQMSKGFQLAEVVFIHDFENVCHVVSVVSVVSCLCFRSSLVESPVLSSLSGAKARRLGQEWGLCDGATSAIFADLGSGVGKLVASC